jgi:hypothetical protein
MVERVVQGHSEKPGQDNECDLVEQIPEELFAPKDVHHDGTGTTATLISDRLTGRLVCRACLGCVHGTPKNPVCRVPNCRCGCKDGPEEQRRERSMRAAARRQREALMRQQLESQDNPLRSINPSYREPWRTRAAKNAKRNRGSNRRRMQNSDSDFAVG